MALTLSQTSPGFYVSAVQVFWKHRGKGEIARNEQFLHFPQLFHSVGELYDIFVKFETWLLTLWVCKSLKFVIWEKVKLQ